MTIAAPILKSHFQKQVTLVNLRNKGATFQNFPYACHATDIHFVHSNWPIGSFDEARL